MEFVSSLDMLQDQRSEMVYVVIIRIKDDKCAFTCEAIDKPTAVRIAIKMINDLGKMFALENIELIGVVGNYYERN